MPWDCPDVQHFWDMVLDVLYKVTRETEKDLKFWFTALSATKKPLVQR